MTLAFVLGLRNDLLGEGNSAWMSFSCALFLYAQYVQHFSTVQYARYIYVSLQLGTTVANLCQWHPLFLLLYYCTWDLLEIAFLGKIISVNVGVER